MKNAKERGRRGWSRALVAGVAVCSGFVTTGEAGALASSGSGTVIKMEPAVIEAIVDRPATAKAGTPADLLVNVNAASAEELEKLPGIGPAKASAIVAYRSKRRFRVVNDLLRVKGIGRELLKRLRPYVTVDDDGLWLAPEGETEAAGR